ncbi:MAG: hypothetical protein M5U08_09315 [Burkholderiales bacterium]|nr:hypothetical protein [Burkholderiales bacterium]
MSQQINLFNPLFLRQKRYFSARTMAQGLGIIAAALAAYWMVVAAQAGGLGAQRADAEAQLAKSREQLAALAAEAGGRGTSAALADALRRTEADLDAQQRLLGALSGGPLGDTTGFSRYLAAFARRPLEGVWLTRVSVAAGGAGLDLRGGALRAELLPAYMALLNGEETLRGQSFGELRMSLVGGEAAAGARAPGAPAGRYIEFALTGVRVGAKAGGG